MTTSVIGAEMSEPVPKCLDAEVSVHQTKAAVNNNNNNTNTNDNVYGAVIITQSLREFTRFI